jgi:hypothetical protein
VKKKPWKLLLATAAFATVPLLSPQSATADEGDDGTFREDLRGPRLIDVDRYVDDDGGLRITFSVVNVGRPWLRYEASAEVRAVFRSATRGGRLGGKQRDRLVIRVRLRDTDTFRVGPGGQIHGELVLAYEDLLSRDFRRGNARPVLVHLSYGNVRLRDITSNRIERLGRISRDFFDDDLWNARDDDRSNDGTFGDGGWGLMTA